MRSPVSKLTDRFDKFVITTLISPRYPGSTTPARVVSPFDASPDRSSITAPTPGGNSNAIPVETDLIVHGSMLICSTQNKSAPMSPYKPTWAYFGTWADG